MWPSLEHFPCLAFFKSVKGARYPALIGHRMIILSTLHHAALWGYHKLIWKMWDKPYWILPRHACRRTRVKLCQRLRLNPRVYWQMETDKPIVCLPRPNYEIKSTISLFFSWILHTYTLHMTVSFWTPCDDGPCLWSQSCVILSEDHKDSSKTSMMLIQKIGMWYWKPSDP